MAMCKNCLKIYEPTTDDSYKGFCSRSCKELYRMFDIAKISGNKEEEIDKEKEQ